MAGEGQGKEEWKDQAKVGPDYEPDPFTLVSAH
jgi:hypothetical protein